MLTAFTLALAAAANPCPNGDAPQGLLGELDVGAVDVSLVVDDVGVGHLRYRAPWTNATAAAGTATLTLSPSPGQPLVVTNARIVGRGAATLDEASVATEAFDGFTQALEMGVAADAVRAGKRRAALEVNSDGATVNVRVAAACSERAFVVEIEALMESEPSSAGLHFDVPAVVGARLVVDNGDRGDVFVDGGRGARANRVVVGAASDVDPFAVDVGVALAAVRATGAVVDLVPVDAPVIAADPDEAAEPAPAEPVEPAVPFSIVHLGVDVPNPLAKAPAELRVVFVVDASVSAGDEGVALALSVVNEFLDAAPDDVGWALITASRTPHLLVPPWRTKSQRGLPHVDVHNGSNVGAALALAQKIAADAAPGAGRVVVLSDLQLKNTDAPKLAVELGLGDRQTLTHVVNLPADAGTAHVASYDRVFADDDVRAFAVERTGGVFVSAYDGEERSDLGRHLVAPTHLDRPTVLIDGVDIDDAGEFDTATRDLQVWNMTEVDATTSSMPLTLDAGAGIRASFRVAHADRAAFTGFLWAARVDAPMTTSKTTKVLGLGVAANGGLGRSLSDEEVRAAAHAGHFVSRVTSFIDVPTWRPLEGDVMVGHGCSCCSCCCRCGGGYGHGCTMGVGTPHISKAQELLDGVAADAAAACKVDRAAFDVEYGDGEVLDVKVAAGGSCVAEFVWGVRLDQMSPDFEPHQSRSASWQAPPSGDPSVEVADPVQ